MDYRTAFCDLETDVSRNVVSISLYRSVGGRYYVTVYLYNESTYDFEENKVEKGIRHSYIFETTLKDSILFIVDAETYP